MPSGNDQLEQLKQKYASVLNSIQQHGVRLQNVHVEGGKLLIRGLAPSEDIKNQIWNQIKLVDPSHSDLTADISVDPNAAPAASGSASGAGAGQKYTVQAGDTLSKIAKQFLGDSNAYMDIYNANRDQLSDPDKIHPGQQLTIPSR
ncbi:MAG: LysM peptidoglycan-binding domain-containing protein [Bryobacteraceae bacterium]